MRINLEAEDIRAIADKVVELLSPYFVSISTRDEYLDIQAASVLLGKSPSQIYQWVNKSAHGLSNFPYMKTGKSLRFSKVDLTNWMKKNGKPLEKG